MTAKKIGRPTDNPEDVTMKIRLDQNSFEEMEKCNEETGISRAEMVRRGIHEVYDDLKK